MWETFALPGLPKSLVGSGFRGFCRQDFWRCCGQPVIDLCAAPGGKTLQLADAGARVASVDVASERLGMIAENPREPISWPNSSRRTRAIGGLPRQRLLCFSTPAAQPARSVVIPIFHGSKPRRYRQRRQLAERALDQPLK
jgi:hypothetical protein